MEEERNAHSLHLQTCVCVLSMLGGGTATISILNQECVLMSIFGGGATISIFNCVCVLMSMLGGGTAVQQQSPSSTVYVCSCPCCVFMSCLEWHSHNLHLETCVCLLMSMLGGEEWEDLLGYKRKAYIHYNSNVF